MNIQEVLDLWDALIESYEERKVPFDSGERLIFDEHVASELRQLSDKIESLPSLTVGDDWSPLGRLFYDTMFFIELHLTTTDYSGNPVSWVSGEKLDAGVLILSILREAIDELV